MGLSRICHKTQLIQSCNSKCSIYTESHLWIFLLRQPDRNALLAQYALVRSTTAKRLQLFATATPEPPESFVTLTTGVMGA